MLSEVIIGSIPMLVALLLSILKYKKLEPKVLRFFTWLLLASFLIQLAGFYYSKYTHKSNHFIFNIQTLVVYSAYMGIFFSILQKKWLKRCAIVLLSAFVLIYFFRILFAGSLFKFDSEAGTIGELATLCCCLLYLSELLTAEERINFFTIPMFWITTGIMAGVIGDFIYIAFFDFIVANNLDPKGDKYALLVVILSFIQYSFFTIAFMPTPLWIKAKLFPPLP
ncbi:hypothetical protein [Mucilaginibacter pedocola]|uniref:Uncharacterized protein n=1 Tax=Mucilaginibacter pedocola TaxID=1792845 RepID=A0A1S9PAG1_9SPHI|nr:hypothetical protein [Mucilaginibacter pedocola]OOQ57973.1 hypothetical protein BC343_09890 [Mucilaginibacter pedocola]